ESHHLSPHAMGNLRAGGPGAQYLARYLELRHAEIRKVPMWDEVTAAIAIDPSVVSRADERFFTVSTNKGTHHGEVSILSAAHHYSKRPIRIVRRVDASMVRAMLSHLVIDKE